MPDSRNDDLALLLNRILAEVRAREEPILAAHDLTMWDYAVLGALADRRAESQVELARLTRRDKTRLIENLDRLESAGLVRRTVDPADRRNRVVELTRTGKARHARCRKAIREMEDTLLAPVAAARRPRLISDLAVVVDALDR